MDANAMPMVLHVRVVTETGGGPEKTILNSPRHLADLGYASRCAYLHPPHDPGFEEIRRRAEQLDAPLDSVPDRGPLDVSVAARLLRLCKQHQVRIWHGHDYKSNALGILLSRVWPMRLVTTAHGWVRFTKRTPVYYALDRLSLKFYHRVICVSPDLHERCLAAGVPALRCVLVENAIDTEAFRREAPAAHAKQELGVSSDRLVIGAIGRLSPEKRFAELIRIVRQLVSDHMNCELWIIGEGSERPRLEALIRDLRLSERVRLFGFRPDVRELLQAMDVFALCSLREGLPNVVLEAMACEVPVVATDVGGISRAIAHNVNGLLIDPADEAGFRAALAALLANAQQRRTLSRAARITVEDRYSFRRRMQKIAAIYDQVLSERALQSKVKSVADG